MCYQMITTKLYLVALWIWVLSIHIKIFQSTRVGVMPIEEDGLMTSYKISKNHKNKSFLRCVEVTKQINFKFMLYIVYFSCLYI